MMKIEVSAFRCWKRLSVRVPEGKVCLVQGPSGSGKSTLIQAICWCLYGVVRNTSPHEVSHPKTSVCVVVSVRGREVRIERRKNPNRLLFSSEGRTEEDKVAQSMIDEIFGAYDLWMSSCYVPQGSRNSFISSSNPVKMDLLSRFAFLSEDPTSYIEKLEERKVQLSASHDLALASFNGKLEELTEMMKHHSSSDVLSSSERKVVEEQIEAMERNLLLIEEVVRDRDSKLLLLESLRRKLSKIFIEEVELPTLSRRDLEDLLSVYSELELLPSHPVESHPVESVESHPVESERLEKILPRLEYVEGERRRNEEICRSLGVEYREQTVGEEIVKLEGDVEELKRWKTLQGCSALPVPERRVERPPPVDGERRALLQMESRSKKMSCPSCSQLLSLREGVLVTSDAPSGEVERELIEMAENESRMREFERQEREIEKTERENETRERIRRSLNFTTSSPPSVDPRRLSRLKEVRFLDPSEEERLRRSVSSRVTELRRSTREEYPDASSVRKAISRISEYESQRSKIELKVDLEDEIEEVRASLPKMDLEEERRKVLRSLEERRNRLSSGEGAARLLSLHSSLSKERTSLEESSGRLSSLHRLLDLARESESAMLQKTADEINCSTNDVLTQLFEREISVDLNLFKTTKTTRLTRPTINFSITYGGGSYDNISQLSGGEGDRVSLAFTVALNLLSSCPLLMLDESLSSLDVTTKDLSVKTLKKSVESTVLVVAHDTTEGFFDSVIDVEEIGEKY